MDCFWVQKTHEILIWAIEYGEFKGSSNPSHFIFEINVEKGRIRHRTTLDLNLQSILILSRYSSFKFIVVVCRIRLFPTLISKIKWLRPGLPLKRGFENHTFWRDIFYGCCILIIGSHSRFCLWGFMGIYVIFA